MNIKKRKGYCIFDFEHPELTQFDIEELRGTIEKCRKNTKIALNFENIERVHESFFDFIKKADFSLLSPKSPLLALFSLRKTFNLTPIYLSAGDFLKNKRQIIKRDFRVV